MFSVLIGCMIATEKNGWKTIFFLNVSFSREHVKFDGAHVKLGCPRKLGSMVRISGL